MLCNVYCIAYTLANNIINICTLNIYFNVLLLRVRVCALVNIHIHYTMCTSAVCLVRHCGLPSCLLPPPPLFLHILKYKHRLLTEGAMATGP